WVDDLGAGLLSLAAMAVEVVDGDVGPALTGPTMVVLAPPGAEHDQPVAVAKLSMGDAPVGIVVYDVALEPERPPEPVDGGTGVAVAHGGIDIAWHAHQRTHNSTR